MLARAAEATAVAPDAPTVQHANEPLTAEGTIVGAFQYMAPEQLEGLTADARTNIFAFGTLLHEMVTDEAIATPDVKQYESVPVKVVRPEYLIALYLEGSAKTPKRRERAAALRQTDAVDQTLLQDVMHRFKLTF